MISTTLPTYNRTKMAFTHGKGSRLYTDDGTPYLDMGAGIAVCTLGHAHPALTQALCDQARQLWHVSNLYRIPHQEKLADMLVEHSFADTVFFTNSGTEAAELALKMARKYWYEHQCPERVEFVSFEGCFHGRSTGAIAASMSEKMTKGYGPLMPGFHSVPFGDMAALRRTVTDKTAAIIAEPIQGEGGIRVLSAEQLKALRALCDETGTLLILDEVQCGMGRTGRLFAHEWAGITPDIMMVAKGIGGGFPLGAVLAGEKAAFGMTVGSHGSTYGGNPLGCAVGMAVMDIITKPDFLAEVTRKGAMLHQGLTALTAAHPNVFEEVRGQGLMLGLKCKMPNSDILAATYAQKLLVIPAADNALRILPALNISDEDITDALARLDRAAQHVTATLTQNA